MLSGKKKKTQKLYQHYFFGYFLIVTSGRLTFSVIQIKSFPKDQIRPFPPPPLPKEKKTLHKCRELLLQYVG